MADVKSEISRIFGVKYLTFLTSNDDFSVAAKNGPNTPHLHVLTFPPLIEGCSEGLDAFRFFFKILFVDVAVHCNHNIIKYHRTFHGYRVSTSRVSAKLYFLIWFATTRD